jgi:hypothetical protein
MKNEEKAVWEMHRSEAITILLSKEKHPSHYSNLRLAQLLEFYYPNYDRIYIVREDDINILNKNYLSPKDFFHERERGESV